MGVEIQQDQFSPEDHTSFGRKIRDNLKALQQVLAQPGFGAGPMSLGAELECYLVDSNGHPANCNQAILQQMADPQLTPELNRFNLEYNLNPQPFAGAPFAAFERDLQRTLAAIAPCAQRLNATLLPIGILPTLMPDHFNQQTMTDLHRYRAMDNALKQLRGGPFQIAIDGDPPLQLQWPDVTLEGANTSFQVHWRMPPAAFRDSFNAVQLLTPVALALGANSPYLFGHALWDETRIALFKQSIDARGDAGSRERCPPRVYFGNGWLHDGALELFASTVALFPPILPVVHADDPLTQLAQGELPALHELKLHQGTTWPWNRAIYDHHDGGHVRIEMRALPAGPSLVDMSATAALLIGSALALRDSMPARMDLLPFKYAERNFYRAAQQGMGATLLWPSSSQVSVVEYPVTQLARRLLPLAGEALVQAGMDSADVQRLMDNIALRLDADISGARWQRQVTQALERQGLDRAAALHDMLQRYQAGFQSGQSIAQWSTAV